MLIEIGERVHIIERRRFETDVRRHFFGVVDGVDGLAIRTTGYSFVYDSSATTFVRHDAPRTRVIALTSDLIVNIAPPETNPEDVRYDFSEAGKLTVTDGGAFSLDINEFGRFR